jgi:hypothetical protein
MTNGHILRCTEDMASLPRTPRQAIPLSVLPNEPNVGFAHAGLVRLAGMFRAIKDEHLAADGLGRDHVGFLGHVAGAVDLALVVDPLDDGDARCGRDGVPA